MRFYRLKSRQCFIHLQRIFAFRRTKPQIVELNSLPTPEFAKTLRPQLLPSIETQLLNPGLNSLFKRDGKVFDNQALQGLQPIKGWIVNVEKVVDGEGPSYTIDLGFEHVNQIHVCRYEIEYDGLGWTISSPEHRSWFERTMIPGKSLTLLVDAKNPSKPVIFGQLELFYWDKDQLIWIADRDLKPIRIFKP